MMVGRDECFLVSPRPLPLQRESALPPVLAGRASQLARLFFQRFSSAGRSKLTITWRAARRDIGLIWARIGGGETLAMNRPSGAPDPDKLRELAAWYREFAERAGSSTISESRLQIAEELDEEADLLEDERKATG